MQTYGWDTVFATSIAHANQLIASHQNEVIKDFEIAHQDIHVRGELGPWRIIPGGAGKLLHLEVPIVAGSLSGMRDPAEHASLAGVSVVLELALQLLPEKVNGEPVKTLKFDFTKLNTSPNASAPGLVTPIRTLDPQQQLKAIEAAILPELIAEYLVTHADLISLTLAQIDLLKHSGAPWLTPTSSDYCYFETQDGRALLAILSVNDGRDVSQLTRSLDPTLLAPDMDGFLVLDHSLFMRHLVLPILPGSFKGAKASWFKYDAAKGEIRNTKALPTAKVKSYQPYIRSLRLRAEKNAFHIEASGDCALMLGIKMKFSVSCVCQLEYDAKAKQFVFKPDPSPKSHEEMEIPWYVHVASYLLAGVVGLVMSMLIPLLTKGIAASLTQQTTKLTLAKTPPQTVRWNGKDNLQVKQAALEYALYMRGCFG